MDARALSLLTRLLARPTAPFRERAVLAFAQRALMHAGVPHFLDPAGNLVVGAASPAAYRELVHTRTREPLRLFLAHADHPGLHGARWLGPDRLAVRWHGGAPVRRLRGARLWLADDSGYRALGRFTEARLDRAGRTIAGGTGRIERTTWRERPPAATLFGGFAFRASVWRQGRRLYTKAADDLVGVFAVLETARALFARPYARPPFLAVLTRAEEVGFVGAVAHLELGWLDGARRPLLAVSLETSRTLPGALIGKGPVVRLGDRRTVFDPGALRVLTDLAERVLPKRHQRRVMDGGTCEATAAIAWGLAAIGLSVPLGNYHNECFEGGPEARAPRGPAPEFVHLDDVTGMLKLCTALMRPRLPWGAPWTQQRRRLRRHRRRYRKLLE